MDELISSKSLTMERPGRDGYIYTVECGPAGDYSAIARHPAAPQNSSIRYPTLGVDQTMLVRELQ
jgi:hypothetical protein